MEDLSLKKALILPTLLAAITLVLASVISLFTGVSGYRVFVPYVSAWAASALLSVLIWVFVEIARLAPTRAQHPIRKVVRRIRQPTGLILVPGFIFPIFIGAYTWAKCSIPFAVGYRWERVWADADHLLLGKDAWQLAHSLIPAAHAADWTYFYAVIWGYALVFSGGLIAAFATRRFAATFFTAMMLSWLFGGIFLAFLVSAAGPVFAHLVDPEMIDRFAPLRFELTRILPQDDLVLRTQRYLAAGMRTKIALKGGGVSAMPSMHIATATTFIIGSWRTRWFWLAVLFWLLTFLGSIYLGYHYAVDAPIAAAVALLCWGIAWRFYRTTVPRPIVPSSDSPKTSS